MTEQIADDGINILNLTNHKNQKSYKKHTAQNNNITEHNNYRHKPSKLY